MGPLKVNLTANKLLEDVKMVRVRTLARNLQNAYTARIITIRTAGTSTRMLKVIQWTTNQILKSLIMQ
jgi:hypothetical protein